MKNSGGKNEKYSKENMKKRHLWVVNPLQK